MPFFLSWNQIPPPSRVLFVQFPPRDGGREEDVLLLDRVLRAAFKTFPSELNGPPLRAAQKGSETRKRAVKYNLQMNNTQKNETPPKSSRSPTSSRSRLNVNSNSRKNTRGDSAETSKWKTSSSMGLFTSFIFSQLHKLSRGDWRIFLLVVNSTEPRGQTSVNIS